MPWTVSRGLGAIRHLILLFHELKLLVILFRFNFPPKFEIVFTNLPELL